MKKLFESWRKFTENIDVDVEMVLKWCENGVRFSVLSPFFLTPLWAFCSMLRGPPLGARFARWPNGYSPFTQDKSASARKKWS